MSSPGPPPRCRWAWWVAGLLSPTQYCFGVEFNFKLLLIACIIIRYSPLPSSLTALLSHVNVNDDVELNVRRCRLAYSGQAVTSAGAWFSVALCPRKPWGSLGWTAQDGHLDSQTAPELWGIILLLLLCCLMSSDVGWHVTFIRDKLRPMPKHGST